MKRRFILAISLFFIGAYALLSFLQFHYFEQERIRLIDQQIDRTVSVILSSDLDREALENREDVEDLILGSLEEEPLNLIILLRSNGKVVYRNRVAEALNLTLPEDSGRREEFLAGHRVRYLTFPLAAGAASLQVGMALDQREISWEQMRGKILGWSALVCLAFVGLAFLLSNYLLRPVTELALYFEYQANHPEEKVPLPTLAKKSREFRRLGKTVRRVTARWQELLMEHGSLMARLGHEIRTPLTIVRNQLEASRVQEALVELNHIEKLTHDFLAWSKLEHSAEPNLHAIQLRAFVEALDCVRSGIVCVEFSLPEGARVFAQPEHMRMVLENFLENARRYGEAGQPITLRVKETSVEVRSHGEEAAAEVVANLGRPFNRSGGSAGSLGLGLANVASICKKYGWKLEFSREGRENVFRVNFSS